MKSFLDLELDRLARVAARVCETPIRMITLVDENGHKPGSLCGIDAVEAAELMRFCVQTASEQHRLVVNDAQHYASFCGPSLDEPKRCVCFYLGVPLIAHDGALLGYVKRDGHGTATPRDSAVGRARRAC